MNTFTKLAISALIILFAPVLVLIGWMGFTILAPSLVVIGVIIFPVGAVIALWLVIRRLWGS